MPKKSRIAIRISLPDSHGVDRVVVQDGAVRMFDRAGQEVSPTAVERITEYDRTKGPKIQARLGLSVAKATVGSMEILSSLDHFFAIDANTANVHGVKMTAAFFMACKLERRANGYELKSLDNRGYVYEFHDVPGNPEFFAIRRLVNDVVQSHPLAPDACVGFITDSDLGRHDEINNRTVPLYGEDYLPPQFKLLYASSDTGSELMNRLIRFCDKRAASYIKSARKHGITLAGLCPSPEAPHVTYKCTYYPTLSITNPVVTDAQITEETTITMHVS